MIPNPALDCNNVGLSKILAMLAMGFSSGLPLLLTGGTLQARMTDAKVDLTTIGLYSLVGLPYTLKMFWAPFMDRFVPLALGRRRGWLLITQVALACALLGLGAIDPQSSLLWTAVFALLVTFFSASQDIVADAYRREACTDKEQGMAASIFIAGYRIGMLVAGGFAVFLASILPWPTVYAIMAAWMGLGIVATILVPEPKAESRPRTFREAVVEPFREYFTRHGFRGAIVILGFVLLYKLGDAMATSMTTPLILRELAYSKAEYGFIVKTFGMGATIAGGLIGGAILLRARLVSCLWGFGILQAVAVIGFWLLAIGPHATWFLALIITVENLFMGMGSSAHVAFMASQTNRQFSATQYALLSSLMGIPRVVASSATGWMVEQMGWALFFFSCALISAPGLLLIPRLPGLRAK